VTIIIGLALVKVYVVTQPELVERYQQEIFPVQAVAWIEINHPDGNLFNDYNWGGYLVWELRDMPVFIDGRTDLYDDELLTDYLLTLSGEADWQQTLDRFGVEVVLIKRDSGLARALEHTVGWSREYADGLAVVYVRDG
jgi:hypothetical protein